MRTWIGTFIVAASAATSPLSAQAPAAAPVGSTGLCKDGTYETAAVKSGACSGHKGVQAWYAAAGAVAAGKAPKSSKAAAAKTAPAAALTPAPTAAKAAAKPAAATPAAAPKSTADAMPVPAAAAVVPPSAKPTAAPKTSTASTAARKEAAPGGGTGLVWLNSASKIYHCFGAADYGTTKAGGYMSEAAAKAAGNRAAHNKACSN